MLVLFHRVANKAFDSDGKSERVMAKLLEAEVENEVCDDDTNRPMFPDVQKDPISLIGRDGIVTCNTQKPVGDPSKRPRRGRPPINRKKPMIEKIIKTIRKSSKKLKASRGRANSIPGRVEDGDMDVRTIHTHALEFDEIITQESVDFSSSQIDLDQTPMELDKVL
ncbi:uncharacterized protein LOC131322166 [Rhododendron vialii]|uniref:uncharacterized protein LOC131322166 n=1 Tax=Rhododendron vialii TaxID=182163 RepID=UPI00265E6655|nr:uncharacterized protein LOC131322166 [Rhododendron vialii]